VLDNKTEQMLKIASLLTAEDLDEIRTGSLPWTAEASPQVEVDAVPSSQTAPSGQPAATNVDAQDDALTRGERERQRTRESKVSTACVGQPRESHEWWPVGTQLIGRIASEAFHASVVENPRVKSGRSLRIDSGPAQGRICITPTRAAIEATEEYRRSSNIGRGGGVTNGWTFWRLKQTAS